MKPHTVVRYFICSLYVFLLSSTSSFGQLDLRVEADRTDFLPFMQITFKVALSNLDSLPVSDVVVQINYPDTVIVPTANIEASNGRYFSFSRRWEIDEVQGYGQETLQITLFTVKDWIPITFTASVNASTAMDSVLLIPMPIERRIPDLYLFNPTLPDTVLLDGSITRFPYRIHNKGYAVANENFKIYNYVSKDTVLSEEDVLVGEVLTGNINTLDTFDVGGAISIPKRIPTGKYYLIFQADAENVIHELDETNNYLVDSFFLINLGSNVNFRVDCPEDTRSIFPPFPKKGSIYGATKVALPQATSDCPFEGIDIELLSDHDYNRLLNHYFVEGEGAFDIVFSIKDQCGNEAICSYIIENEIQAPIAYFEDCPSDIEVQALPNSDGETVNYEMPTFFTTCPEAADVRLSDGSLSSGSRFPIGTTPIQIIGKAGACGVDTCRFNVTVVNGGLANDNQRTVSASSVDVNLFPSVVQDVLTVRSTFEITQIQISNEYGFPITRRQFDTPVDQVEFDVTTFKTGMYFIQLQGAGISTTQGFIKSR